MAHAELSGKRVAILATDGVEQIELTDPRDALEAAGAEVHLISPKGGSIRAWEHSDWGDELPVDVSLESAKAEDYDALLLPGGVMNPDRLRQSGDAVLFVRRLMNSGKPVASICHGPWLLVEADVIRGARLTSWPSLEADIRNAGGRWVDEEVVTDQGLVTSRGPDDLPAFNKKMIEEFAEGVHTQRKGRAASASSGS